MRLVSLLRCSIWPHFGGMLFKLFPGHIDSVLNTSSSPQAGFAFHFRAVSSSHQLAISDEVSSATLDSIWASLLTIRPICRMTRTNRLSVIALYRLGLLLYSSRFSSVHPHHRADRPDWPQPSIVAQGSVRLHPWHCRDGSV